MDSGLRRNDIALFENATVNPLAALDNHCRPRRLTAEDQLLLKASFQRTPAGGVAVNISFTKAAQTKQSGASRPNAVKLDAKVAIAIWIKSRPFWTVGRPGAGLT